MSTRQPLNNRWYVDDAKILKNELVVFSDKNDGSAYGRNPDGERCRVLLSGDQWGRSLSQILHYE